MKKVLWLVLAALPLAFAAAPAPSKTTPQSKPAVTQVVKKSTGKMQHRTAKRKVMRHVKHVAKKASTHKAAKPVKATKPVKKP